MKPAVIAVVGRSGTGKTTLIEKLVPALTAQGLRVSTIKHTHHRIDPDTPGKDSYRHRQAGTQRTALSGPGFCCLWLPDELSPERLVEFVGQDSDLVLVEGFKSGPFPILEVVRGRPPILAEEETWLTATDDSIGRAREVPLSNIAELLGELQSLIH